MNKKAEVGKELGAILIVFITILLGVILFQAIAQESGKATTLGAYTNFTTTLAAPEESIYLTDIKHISSIVIENCSAAGAVFDAGNYSVTNNFVHDGALTVRITTTAGSNYNLTAVNISGVTQPLTYIDDSGARSMVPLIAIFFALALAVVALVPTLRNEFVSGMMNR